MATPAERALPTRLADDAPPRADVRPVTVPVAVAVPAASTASTAPAAVPPADTTETRPDVERRMPSNVQLRQHLTELLAATGDRVGTLTFYLVMTCIIVAGWYADLERFITPEFGLGYLLGIVGGSLMLILLVYPMRKRLPRLRWMGSVGGWFKAHMMMGVLGPACILYHCQYKLGALNSNVALVCMLTVSWSGVFGRYFYTRIHYGLYGAKATRAQLAKDVALTRTRLAELYALAPALERQLNAFADVTLKPVHGEFRNLGRALSVGLRTHWEYARAVPHIRHAVATQAGMAGWTRAQQRRHLTDSLKLVQLYVEILRKHAQISFFEKLFALWHILHVPLFAMMVVAAVVHVVAVHIF